METNDIQAVQTSLEKIRKTCRGIKTFIRVVIILYIIGLAVAAVVLLTAKILGLPLEAGANEVIDMVLSALYYCSLLFTAYLFFYDIVADGTPFLDKQVKRISFIGWATSAYAVMDLVKGTIIFVPVYMNYMTESLVLEGIAPPLPAYNTNIYVVLAGLACLAVAVVFRYGILLQQLSDETL
ncbi:MAG: hypothetical protein FWH40_03495 [Coriobacteriia bacterium]|nr:hypothetical protein [Coriobacteriia bacterium]